jgi:predicted regulator of Ras-like GTPase activity (Roadblock/LC7/MglB family)
MRIGALKGIAFLYFRAGDVPAALEHLGRAAEIDPDDPTIIQAIERVRSSAAPSSTGEVGSAAAGAADEATGQDPEPVPGPALNGYGEHGVMLVDSKGLRLNGTLLSPAHDDVGDRVAAELAGVSKEATRTSRLLGLGTWEAIAVESPEGNLYLVAPTPDTMLLTVREASLPMARLGLIAERAARDARAWLESHG